MHARAYRKLSQLLVKGLEGVREYVNITSHLVLCSTTHIHTFTVYPSRYSFFLSSLCLKLMRLSLSLPSSFHKLQEDVELEWLRQTEVLYYRLECSHSNAVPQLKHNPWSLRCQQQHLQKMKENAKHRNQYSILSLTEDCAVGLLFFFIPFFWSTFNITVE